MITESGLDVIAQLILMTQYACIALDHVRNRIMFILSNVTICACVAVISYSSIDRGSQNRPNISGLMKKNIYQSGGSQSETTKMAGGL